MTKPMIPVRVESSRPLFIEADPAAFGAAFARMGDDDQVLVLHAMVEAMKPHRMQWDYIAILLERPENREVRDVLAGLVSRPPEPPKANLAAAPQPSDLAARIVRESKLCGADDGNLDQDWQISGRVIATLIDEGIAAARIAPRTWAEDLAAKTIAEQVKTIDRLTAKLAEAETLSAAAPAADSSQKEGGLAATILALLGNVDHSKGGGENAARLYGGMLESIRELCGGTLPDRGRKDPRPANCRFRLKDEGLSYPRSSCQGCGRNVMTGLGRECHLTRFDPDPGSCCAVCGRSVEPGRGKDCDHGGGA